MYVASDKSRQARGARRSSRLLEFLSAETGRRIVPHLTLDPPEPEESGWVAKYLDLADRALRNPDLPNPAAGPAVTLDLVRKRRGNGG